MAYCPRCKQDWDEGTSTCPVCGGGLTVEDKDATDWVKVGAIADKVSADFAHETLKTYEIPSVVISKSGLFGNVGLPLTDFHSGKTGGFEISVPSECVEEAIEILHMVLGDQWRPDKD